MLQNLSVRMLRPLAFICLLVAAMLGHDITPSRAATRPQSSYLNQIGQIGGTTNAVALQGHRVFFGIGPRLFAADFTDPTAPVILGSSVPLPEVINDIAISGNHAFVADTTGQVKILATTPGADPQLVGQLDTPGTAFGLAIHGSLLYVADGSDGGIQVADISDPVHPVIIGSYNTPGSAKSLVVSDHLLYLADGYGGIEIFDVTDPHDPTLIGACCGASSPNIDLALSGDYLYTVDGTALTVVDVSNPAAPQKLGSYYTPGEDRTVAAIGSIAYVGTQAEFSSQEGGLRAIDCSDPLHPVEIGFLDAPGEPANLAGSGDSLFLADGSGGLRLVDISSPSTLAEIGVLDHSWLAVQVSLNQNIAYVAGPDSLQVVAAANPARPILMGSLRLPYRVGGMTNQGSTVYIAAGGSLHIVDAHNPASPTEVGNWNPPALWIAVNVATRGALAYVIDLSNGLYIVNVSDPTSPQQVGFLRLSATGAITINEQGTYAFVSTDSAIAVVDISNPAQPSLVASSPVVASVRDMTMDGSRLYTVDATNGLSIYNASNPADLNLLGSVAISPAVDVLVTGSLAYVSAGGNGVYAVDVNNPAAPSIQEQAAVPGDSLSSASAGTTVYVAAYPAGLVVLTSARARTYLPLIQRRS